ncbi:DUF1465 family protein [Sphingomicrobium astaxanthinifaciens]|uniref:DUF1465 family protein n=1 Tax=Sphingomicrobium astaxanthinifaciens TaxID=1227949 RepID=UPI001FCAEE5E|nr:DUF1465 family protein [Sphingomicrobium astaxanthinifaciens]MCJ7420312.1 DUF1465 family protein [Sphingomicrobium astaxanthinifaciens]
MTDTPDPIPEVAHGPRITPRLVDALYREAMLLADEARAYFDVEGRRDRAELPAAARVAFAGESLKVTTRVMHIVAWLLTQKAIEGGEIARGTSAVQERRLGHANPPEADLLPALPAEAQRLINLSTDLYERVKRLDENEHDPAPVESPARALLGRLQRDLGG